MSEYEKVMKVLFDRGLPSETCGRVASIFEKKEELERQLEEASEEIDNLREFTRIEVEKQFHGNFDLKYAIFCSKKEKGENE